MKLYRTLFWIMLTVFIIGIVLCIWVKNDVLSRIAVGLLTGSFIACVNSLTNYLHERKRYFTNLITNLEEVGNSLFDDFNKGFIMVEFIVPWPNDELRKAIPGLMKDKEQESSKKELLYKQLHGKFDSQGFVPLVPFIKSKLSINLGEWFVDINDLYRHYIDRIPTFIKMCFSYNRLLSIEQSKSGQSIPDEFIDSCREECRIFRGMMAYSIVQFKDVCLELNDWIKKEIPSVDYQSFNDYCMFLYSAVEKEQYYDNFGAVVEEIELEETSEEK